MSEIELIRQIEDLKRRIAVLEAREPAYPSSAGILRMNGIITPKIYPASDSTTAIQILKADGTTPIVDVDSTNKRVGIGTVAPAVRLHVAADDSNAQMVFARHEGTATARGALFQFRRSRGTEAAQAIVVADDIMGYIRFNGYDGAAYIGGADIRAEVDGTPGVNDMPTRITLWTCPDGSASLAERMRVDDAGNVIINTAAIATNATDGFLYIPSCAGTPTGTPTTYTGRCAMVFDTTNNKLYVYDGSWIDVT